MLIGGARSSPAGRTYGSGGRLACSTPGRYNKTKGSRHVLPPEDFSMPATDIFGWRTPAVLALALLSGLLPVLAEDAVREPFKSVEDLVKHAKPSIVVISTVGR